METFYTILECEESASVDEIKRKYHSLIKQNHPDKGEETSDKFLKISAAWQTLKDVNLRKQYDAELLQNSFFDRSLIYAEINLDELTFENSMAKYQCRCGDYFVIDKNCISGSIFECSDCSNCIIVRDNKAVKR